MLSDLLQMMLPARWFNRVVNAVLALCAFSATWYVLGAAAGLHQALLDEQDDAFLPLRMIIVTTAGVLVAAMTVQAYRKFAKWIDSMTTDD